MSNQQAEQIVEMHQQQATCVLCGSLFAKRASTQGDYGLCVHCFSRDTLREWDRLASFKKRLAPGLSCSLSFVEWLEIVTSWRGFCALCEEVQFSHIDVLDQPLGLIAENTIPTCRACHIHLNGSFLARVEQVKAIVTP